MSDIDFFIKRTKGSIVLIVAAFLFSITSIYSQPLIRKQNFYDPASDLKVEKAPEKNPSGKPTTPPKEIKILREEYYVLQTDTNTRHGAYKKFSGIDGKLLESGFYKMGKKDSLWLEFYEGGMLKSQSFYRNGTKTGEASYYSYEGELLYKEIFRYEDPSDPVNGNYQKTDKENKILALGKIRNQNLDSILTEYYEGGAIKARSSFKEGLRDGPTFVYTRDGKIWQKAEYREGKMEGEIATYYPDGKLKNQAWYKDGALNGVVREFYSNGNKQSEAEYKDNIQSGIARSFYENGNLKTEEFYINGQLHGYFKTYYPNGKLNTESVIIDGKKNGIFKSYNTNGILVLEGGFKNGILEGENKGYYDDGKIKHKFNYKDGKKTGKNLTYYQNGNISLEEIIKENEKGISFKIKAYYENGKLESYKEFLEPAGSKKSSESRIKVGEWLYYYENEKLKIKEFYQNDRLHGARLIYHLNGSLEEKQIYSNGVRIGIWFTYYQDGKIKSESNYKSNALYGNFKSYHSNGKTEVTGHYVNNKKNGHWMYYNEEGKHIKTVTYKNGEIIKEKIIEGK
jgi:antitoxin component YwqK of YwqJK toxin-antitoxin module